MRRDNLWLLLLAGLLLLGMLLTLWWGRDSRHGYGSSAPPRQGAPCSTG